MSTTNTSLSTAAHQALQHATNFAKDLAKKAEVAGHNADQNAKHEFSNAPYSMAHDITIFPSLNR